MADYNEKKIAESYAVQGSLRNIRKPEDLPEGWDYLPYQKAGIQLATRRGNVMIADEPGLGKTIQALGTINNTGSERVLIVSPKSLVKSTWVNDAETWLADSPPIFHFADRKRWNVPGDGPAVVVMSYSQLGNYRDELRAADFDMVVLDESHVISNPETKAAQEIVGCVKDACATGIEKDLDSGKDESDNGNLAAIDADRKILLTGTPFRNRHDGLFTQVAYLDPEYWGNPLDPEDARQFNRRYLGTDENGRVISRNSAELGSRLRESVLVRRLKEDVVKDLPAKSRSVIVMDAQGRLAQNVEADLVKATEAGENTPAIEMARLRQQNALAKAPQVAEHVGAIAQREPVVMFAYHQAMIDDVAARLRRQGLRVATYSGATSTDQREAAVRDFQDGKIDVFLGSLGAASTGLTLTRSRRLVIADLDWKPADIIQAEDRVHRLGQKKPVQVDYLVLSPGIDGKMAEVLGQKLQAMEQTLGVSRSAMFARADVVGDVELLGGIQQDEGDGVGGGVRNPGEPRQIAPNDFIALGRDEQVWANRLARERSLCDEYRNMTKSDIGEEVAMQAARLDALEKSAGIDVGELPQGTVALSLQADGSVKALTVKTDEKPPPAKLETEAGDVVVPPDRNGSVMPDVAPDPDLQPDAPPVATGDVDDVDDTPAPGREIAQVDVTTARSWDDLTMAERRKAVAEINDALQRLTVARAIQRKVNRGMPVGRAVDQYCDVVKAAWTELVAFPDIVRPQPLVATANPAGIALFQDGYDRADLMQAPRTGQGYHRSAGRRRTPVVAKPSAVPAGSRRHPFLRRGEMKR